MKEFNIPYHLWDKIPIKSDDRRIGYSELLEYLRITDEILEEKKKEAEEEAEERVGSIGSGQMPRGMPSMPKPRKMVTAVSSVE